MAFDRPCDALNVINWLDLYGAVDSEEVERQIGDADSVELFYFDTTGDGVLSARDALLIINDLIREAVVNLGVAGNPIDSDVDSEVEPTRVEVRGIEAKAAKVASFGTLETTKREAIDVALTDLTGSEDDMASLGEAQT